MMLTVLDTGVADPHERVYVVCSVMGAETQAPASLFVQSEVTEETPWNNSLFVPETVHEATPLTSQDILVLFPLRNKTGLACKCSVTVMAGSVHGKEPPKLVASGF